MDLEDFRSNLRAAASPGEHALWLVTFEENKHCILRKTPKGADILALLKTWIRSDAPGGYPRGHHFKVRVTAIAAGEFNATFVRNHILTVLTRTNTLLRPNDPDTYPGSWPNESVYFIIQMGFDGSVSDLKLSPALNQAIHSPHELNFLFKHLRQENFRR